MMRLTLLVATLAAIPAASFAMPVIGDIVGINAADASAALEKSGCKVINFESENGKIEARCNAVDTAALWEISIDPKTGAVADVKSGD